MTRFSWTNNRQMDGFQPRPLTGGVPSRWSREYLVRIMQLCSEDRRPSSRLLSPCHRRPLVSTPTLAPGVAPKHANGVRFERMHCCLRVARESLMGYVQGPFDLAPHSKCLADAHAFRNMRNQSEIILIWPDTRHADGRVDYRVQRASWQNKRGPFLSASCLPPSHRLVLVLPL